MWAWIQPGSGVAERRPAVVMHVTADKVELVYGQGTPWVKCTCPVLVVKSSYFGSLFPLSKDTYFSSWQVTSSKLIDEEIDADCPESYFDRIEAVEVEARVELAKRRAVAEAAQAYRRKKTSGGADGNGGNEPLP